MNFKIENVMNCVQCRYHSIIVLFDKDADRVSQLEIFYYNKNKSEDFDYCLEIDFQKSEY